MQNGLLSELSNQTRALLERSNFDEAEFLDLRHRFLAGELSADTNRIDGEVELPGDDDIGELPEPNTDAYGRLAEIGQASIDAGEVGVLILNGGMATRFGGVVKGTVEVVDGVSFLGIKLRDAARFDDVPVLLMNSFATGAKTGEHLEENGWFGSDPHDVFMFEQNISLRLTPDGELFRDENGRASPYAPGHGDLPSAVGRGALDWFRARGGKYLLMSNVDNVLASVEPVVVGAHVEASREHGVEMTVESAPRDPGDTGGMPARVAGHVQVVEHFRFPDDFDASSIPVYNTNTFLFDADALDRDFDLTWFVVTKEVDGRKVVQFERLAGELSAFLRTQFLAVDREGESARFLPVKRPEHLEENRDFLESVMKSRGVL